MSDLKTIKKLLTTIDGCFQSIVIVRQVIVFICSTNRRRCDVITAHSSHTTLFLTSIHTDILNFTILTT